MERQVSGYRIIQHRADDYIKIEIAVRAEIADRSGINTAPAIFIPVDQFHGTDFRSTGHGACRKCIFYGGGYGQTGLYIADHRGNKLMYLPEAVDIQEGCRFYAAWAGTPGKVIPDQVNDHDIFS